MDIEKLKSLGGEELMEEYVKEAEEVSFEGGVGEAYDKEWALRDQGYRDGLLQGKAEGKAEGFSQGKAEGKAEGFSQGKVEIAKNMLAKNMEIELISEITSLTEDEINSLK